MKIASQSVYVALKPTCFEHADLVGIAFLLDVMEKMLSFW